MRKKENVVCHTLGPVTYLIVAIITHIRILYARICICSYIYVYICSYIYLYTWVDWLYRFALDDV